MCVCCVLVLFVLVFFLLAGWLYCIEVTLAHLNAKKMRRGCVRTKKTRTLGHTGGASSAACWPGPLQQPLIPPPDVTEGPIPLNMIGVLMFGHNNATTWLQGICRISMYQDSDYHHRVIGALGSRHSVGIHQKNHYFCIFTASCVFKHL